MLTDFKGKSFVITGGLGSIGSATARLLVEKGAHAIVLDVPSSEVGEAIVKAWDNPERYVYETCDIGEEESVVRAVFSGMKRFPGIKLHGGVNCAGANKTQPYTNRMMDKLKDFEFNLKINAYGTFLVNAAISDAISSQYPALDRFADRVTEERGCIVNLASVVAYDTPGRCLTYGPAKTCVLGITNAAADFLGPQGIRVNSVSPGLVFSPMMDRGGRRKYFEEEIEQQMIFPRRFSEAPEMAHAIVFLIENPIMNAFHLKVDSGWRMITPWATGEDDPRKRCLVVE